MWEIYNFRGQDCQLPLIFAYCHVYFKMSSQSIKVTACSWLNFRHEINQNWYELWRNVLSTSHFQNKSLIRKGMVVRKCHWTVKIRETSEYPWLACRFGTGLKRQIDIVGLRISLKFLKIQNLKLNNTSSQKRDFRDHPLLPPPQQHTHTPPPAQSLTLLDLKEDGLGGGGRKVLTLHALSPWCVIVYLLK